MENNNIDILLIEDNPGDVRIVSELLKNSVNPFFNITHAGRISDAIKALKGQKFNIILMDLDLPDSRGMDSLERVFVNEPKVPIIVLTGLSDENNGLQAVQKHAADYLIKGNIDKNILVRSIKYSIERKKAEEVLKRDKKELELLVQDQAIKLMQAHIEAERAKRLSDIGMLAATVAHELRNPLAAINIAAFNIKRKAANPELDKHLQNIQKKVSESEQIINNLLFYSRIKPPQCEDADIYNLIEECLGVTRDNCKKKILFEKSIDSVKEISIRIDILQIKEVMLNLLNNAVDAVMDGKGRIEVTAKNDNEFISIFIKDNGSGIKKEDLDKVFDPFFTTKAKGTGLGLSVCRQIIALHKGTINIKSTGNEGTTAIVQLPKQAC